MRALISSASRSRVPSAAAVLELFKPVTWFPPMWAYVCGFVSAGVAFEGRLFELVLGVLLTGPLVCATSQAVNDWFDRHVDAINEPDRPIPSGRIPGRWGLYIGIAWSLVSLAVALLLGPFVFVAAVVGLVLAWIYSAPPLRLKQNGWWGNAACGACYETLPWVTGAAVMLGGAIPGERVLVAAVLYGIGAHGIMTLNDFKSIEGDRALGLRSLPAMLGAPRAARLACAVMAGAQLVLIGFLIAWDLHINAGIVAVLLLLQAFAMRRLLGDPRAFAPWYNATGVSLYVLGMLFTAFGLRGSFS